MCPRASEAASRDSGVVVADFSLGAREAFAAVFGEVAIGAHFAPVFRSCWLKPRRARFAGFAAARRRAVGAGVAAAAETCGGAAEAGVTGEVVAARRGGPNGEHGVLGPGRENLLDPGESRSPR